MHLCAQICEAYFFDHVLMQITSLAPTCNYGSNKSIKHIPEHDTYMTCIIEINELTFLWMICAANTVLR